jgi:hypothetical protein
MPRAKTLITGPYPTPEEVGRIFGMRMSEVRRIVAEVDQQIAENDRKAAEKVARKKAARNAARRQQRARLKESGSTR